MKSALIIPTLNAMPWLGRLLPALKALAPQPDKILFIDSSSTDGTGKAITEAGFSLHTIRREEFGHGRTRNLGARLCSDADVLIYLTQDALPAGTDLVGKILAQFEDSSVAIVCGRQLPHEDANPAARYARLCNYPPTGHRTTAVDIPVRGIKALFCSNSFAAYRAEALKKAGWFPEELPMGEDLAVTGRILDAGYTSVYLPEAAVYHSHNYSAAEEFRRYFDIGALLRVDPWLRARTLKSGGAGLRFVVGEVKYMLREGHLLDIPGIVPRTAAKYIGFQLGRRYDRLPKALLKRCSMHKYYWGDAV